jgi:hypothetical protein
VSDMDLRYLIHSGLGIPDYRHPSLEIQTDFISGLWSLLARKTWSGYHVPQEVY